VVYLVLAAQFESWVHPFVIMLTVPLAMAGALFGLWWTDQTLNIYSEIGLIMLVGLSAKNGILIVEFANQLRDQGKEFRDALLEAADVRLRPIVMTGITTAAGSMPLLLSSGAGAETRAVIGTVILAGVLAATVFTLFVVPVAYDLLARHTGSPGDVRGGWSGRRRPGASPLPDRSSRLGLCLVAQAALRAYPRTGLAADAVEAFFRFMTMPGASSKSSSKSSSSSRSRSSRSISSKTSRGQTL
jgi:hypothetical protein